MEAGNVTARMGQARNETLTDGIGDDRKDDRDCPRLSLQRSGHRSSECEDHVGLLVYKLFREHAHSINVIASPTNVHQQIAAVDPT